MTDNEIIKALECCIQVDGDVCNVCPLYDKESGCLEIDLRKPALDLINRQKAEIENLKADKKALINGQLTLQKMYGNAIKDFAERLKQSTYFMSDEEGFGCSVVFAEEIDNLVKELTEGNDNA